MPIKSRVAAFLSCVLAGAAVAQQGSFSLSIAPAPNGFATASAATCGAATLARIDDVVRTEPLQFTLTSTPTPVTPPPTAQRRIAMYLGPRDCSGSVTFAGSPVFVSIFGPQPIVPVFDSFADPFDPKFDPAGPSTVMVTFDANLFADYSTLTDPIVFQAFTEDSPGSPTPILVSNAVEIGAIDPLVQFAPTITGLSSSAGTCAPAGGPGGSETGGTVITLTGTNFPVQTNWMQFPPTVMVGNTQATNVVILSQTTLTAVTAGPFPATCPPMTAAGPKDVTLRHHPLISPSAATTMPALSTTKFTYCSGRTPAIAGFSPAMQPVEGGGTITIDGTDFLFGADVVMTAQGAPNLTVTISPPDTDITAAPGSSCAAPTPTAITLAAPPFCAGAVLVRVVNPDGVPSGQVNVSYQPLVAAVQSVTPMTTVAGLAQPNAYAVTTVAGAPITVNGSGFLTPSSPLFGAPTAPQSPSQLHPTRTEIIEPATGAVICSTTSGVVSQTQITVAPCNVAATGPLRPALGVKWLRVVNPPCVDPAPATPTPANTTPILVRGATAPAVSGISPNLVTAGGPGGFAGERVTITGSGFFARAPIGTALPVQQFWNDTNPPPLEALVAPAVSFAGAFSREVELVDETTLRVKVPEGVPGGAVAVTVFNPDGQISGTGTTVLVVPRLTDPGALSSTASPPVRVLDGAALLAMTSPSASDGSIVFAPNLTPDEDRLEDIQNGGDPAVTSMPSAYDAAFVFNTRIDPSGILKCFDFDRIDVPATIVLPAPVQFGPFAIAPGLKRVIFKATAFTLPPVNFMVDQNYPFVLRSHGDFNFSGILDLGGSAFVNQTVANHPTLKFHLRCDWQIPPAAGGIGGRGGLNYTSELAVLMNTNLLRVPDLPNTLPSQPGLTLTALQLTAKEGLKPRVRGVATALDGTPGWKGAGRAQVGGQAGAGGGGGFASIGTNGGPGLTPTSAAGGAMFGNYSNLPPSVPHWPALGDADVYGATSSDFAGPLGASSVAFPFGLFTGGSGGGGGGGSQAPFLPCVAIGGRGGNGGGAAVLLADGAFRLGSQGRIFADGEKGQLGLGAFPVANQELPLIVCSPGCGGGGSGGLIFIAAVVDVDLSAPVVTGTQRILSARGGGGGSSTAGAWPPATGGTGGDGRIRVAMNEMSSKVAQRQSEWGMRISSGAIAPSPLLPLPADFFAYPSP
jgi:hypothetical protein